MKTYLRSLLTDLQTEPHFEAAARLVIDRVLDVIDAAVAASAYATSARTLRGSIHLRVDGAYHAVAQAGRPNVADSDALAAASMWEWIHQHDRSLAVDLALGVVSFVSGERDEVTSFEIDDPRDAEISGRTSLVIFLERDASHVLLMPLHDTRGQAMGMGCFEVMCERAIGAEFIWGQCEEEIAGVLAATAPYLLDRPGEQPPEEEEDTLCDEFLPVLGEQMRGKVALLAAFAAQDETILLSGPTGAGKSRLARWCHARSPREPGPFETLDLLSVPESMQMAHLVGWKRGAFTNAEQDVAGAIERAKGGTLFIDEIDKLSLETQAGLLRLLETRAYQRLGDSRGVQKANVRFIVGTNADLQECVRAGSFREDLFYRIHVLPVHVAPLSERVDEIEAWARYMLARCVSERDMDHLEINISEAAAVRLREHHWPGNLRQLDNLIKRVFAFAIARQPRDELVILLEDIELALSMDGASEPDRAQLVRAMERAAEAFVSAAQRASARGESLSLDLSDAFKGMILLAAEARLEDLDAVFSLLDKENLLNNRNHHKAFKRETERAHALTSSLDE